MNEVEEIKNRLDIVDVINGYVPLKKSGRNFKALSPFHQEKNPSFMVSPEKNIWHDFSTGEGGDIFTFVMRMEGIDFVDALEMLARKAGVTLTRRASKDSSNKKAKLYQALEAAAKYYHLALSKNKSALDYLKKQRGLKPETIRKFMIGYAPNKSDALSIYLTTKGFDGPTLMQAGLAGQRDSRSLYDWFRGRIVFPIYDSQGRIVGFSGRVLDENSDAAKYINSPQTSVYNKSLAIFGLAQAKEAIREVDSVIIVEGNMDVIGLANSNKNNVVAVSGTALTLDQLTVLARITKNIWLCFDADEAGLNATQKAIDLTNQLPERMSVQLKVVSLDSAKDPDELVRRDLKLWDKAAANAKYAVDYLFDLAFEKFNAKTASGKKQISNFLTPTLVRLKDEVEKDHYIKELAERLDVSYSAVRQKVSAKASSTANLVVLQDTTASQPQRASRNEVIEQNILELVLAYPPTSAVLSELKISTISNRYRSIFDYFKKHPQATLAKIIQNLPEVENDVKILALRGEEQFSDLSEQDLKMEAFTQVHRLIRLNLELDKKRLSRQIADAERAGDKELTQKLLAKYQQLIEE